MIKILIILLTLSSCATRYEVVKTKDSITVNVVSYREFKEGMEFTYNAKTGDISWISNKITTRSSPLENAGVMLLDEAVKTITLGKGQ